MGTAGVEMRLALVLSALLPLLVVACSDAPATRIAGADPERGKDAVRRYGCAACHAIPGIAHHGSNVGPPLHKVGRRSYIGGVLPNTPEQMVRWLHDPPHVDPRTAMPALGISTTEARDIAAYLYTLD